MGQRTRLFNRNTQIFTKEQSGSKPKDVTKRFPSIPIHIKREIRSRFFFTNYLPRHVARLIQNIFDGGTINIVCSSEKDQVIRKEQVGKGRPTLRGLNQIPKISIAFFLYELAKEIHAKDEQIWG